MKVLFLMSGSFSTSSTSGHLLSAIIESLAEQRHQIHVLQMIKNGEELLLPESIQKKNVTTEAIYTVPQKKRNLISRYLNANRNFFKCRFALKKHCDCEAVFIQSTNAAGIAVYLVRKYLKNSRITYNVQDIFPYNAVYGGKVKKNSLVFKILAGIQRYGYRHSDHIITISEDMKETLIEDGTDADKVEVIYNWSYQDEPYQDVDLQPVAHMFDKAYFNIVYAGNIGVMQNVDILIETAKQMKSDKNVWFHIIGDGSHKKEIETTAREYGIENISFWPMQPSELAPAIYSAADVNVIPLVKDVYRTALPSKTATCMACRKPIIFAIGKASKFGKKVVEEAGCQVVETNHAEELVDAIRRVQNGKQENSAGEFFLKHCGLTENSRKYAEIIAG